MKFLVFDAGPIISLTMNGLLPVIERLKSVFDGEFIITPAVKREVIDKPLKIKKYELEGLKVKDLMDKGVFSPSSRLISNEKLAKETSRVMKIANSSIRDPSSGEKINLIHEGEASCLAFCNLVNCPGVIVIDERTTRMLIESPKNLKRLMERKLHAILELQESLLDNLKNFKVIRSAELLYIAYKKDLIGLKKDKTLLDALMYGVKAKGAAISSKEINSIKALA